MMVKKCICIRYGDTVLPESWIFAGGEKEKSVPIIFAFYLLETDEGKILVDAGCDTGSDFFPMENFLGPVAALKEQGTQPEEITDIILTHNHHDHAQGICHFPGAVVHVQKEEYEKAKKYFSEHTKVHVFEDICKVGCLTAVKVGGHSVGSCVVEFAMNGQRHVICGDECYTKYNLENKVPTAKSFCKEASQTFIEKYANGDYICHLCHDM